MQEANDSNEFSVPDTHINIPTTTGAEDFNYDEYALHLLEDGYFENIPHIQPGKKVILPSTHVGSIRYVRQQYMDAMAIVAKFRKPDLFLTLTLNPVHKNVTDYLSYAENIYRSDLHSRVFHEKVKSTIDDVVKKQIFGQTIAHFSVIEFQVSLILRIFRFDYQAQNYFIL